ncbi:MAG: hypothetical protein GY803_30110 [Chloroflexi bacterium]|nr:hypothetical protein [Chloroflexota bacterium]
MGFQWERVGRQDDRVSRRGSGGTRPSPSPSPAAHLQRQLGNQTIGRIAQLGRPLIQRQQAPGNAPAQQQTPGTQPPAQSFADQCFVQSGTIPPPLQQIITFIEQAETAVQRSINRPRRDLRGRRRQRWRFYLRQVQRIMREFLQAVDNHEVPICFADVSAVCNRSAGACYKPITRSIYISNRLLRGSLSRDVQAVYAGRLIHEFTHFRQEQRIIEALRREPTPSVHEADDEFAQEIEAWRHQSFFMAVMAPSAGSSLDVFSEGVRTDLQSDVRRHFLNEPRRGQMSADDPDHPGLRDLRQAYGRQIRASAPTRRYAIFVNSQNEMQMQLGQNQTERLGPERFRPHNETIPQVVRGFMHSNEYNRVRDFYQMYRLFIYRNGQFVDDTMINTRHRQYSIGGDTRRL